MARFAQGRYSLAISDISGQAFPWNEMVTQWNGLFVHFSEFESKQPQLDPKPSAADPTALTTTRPQQDSPDSLRFLSFNPISTLSAGSGIINIFEENHGRQYGSFVKFRGPSGIAGVFNNIANIDGITGAQICDLNGFTIIPGRRVSTATTITTTTTATQTTGIILTSVTGFQVQSPRTPGSVNFFSGGTPINGIKMGTEILVYTGISITKELEGVVRGTFSSTAAAHTAGDTARCLPDPLNNYNVTTAGTAISGQTRGGGYNTSSGPVTLKAIGPQ